MASILMKSDYWRALFCLYINPKSVIRTGKVWNLYRRVAALQLLQLY